MKFEDKLDKILFEAWYDKKHLLTGLALGAGVLGAAKLSDQTNTQRQATQATTLELSKQEKSTEKSIEKSSENRLTTNFKLEDFACKDGTSVPKELIPNITKLAQNLQVLQDSIGKSIHITSGYRTLEYNKKQPGAVSGSMHVQAKAADIQIKGMTPKQVAEVINKLIKDEKMFAGGIGTYGDFVHYDIGRHRSW